MDEASNNVLRFLQKLQVARDGLTGLWHELSVRSANPGVPYLILSGRVSNPDTPEAAQGYLGSVSIGIRTAPQVGEPVEYEAEILWDNHEWMIRTEVWVDSDNNQDLLYSFPERRAETLDACLAQLDAAIADLSSCSELPIERGHQ